MRLRVKIKNSKENRIELTFADLCVKYSNGYSPVLKVPEGQEIPLDVLDAEDVRKSLKVGSLQGYLANGWVEEFVEEIQPIIPVIEVKSNSQFISEYDVNKIPNNVVPPSKILPEVKAVDQTVLFDKNEPITDISKVFSYEDFNKLSHFLKLRFIKESQDIGLLKDIAGKTPSAQFKNNLTLRLSGPKI